MSGRLFTLLNTRPAHQASKLTDAVKAMQGDALLCPTLAIQWINRSSFFQEHDTKARYQKIIFISANAVDGFVKSGLDKVFLSASRHTESPIFYAIGRATQQRGLALGLPLITLSTTQFDSESLLAHPEMASLDNECILIVKGVGGRRLLEQTLTQRGARVDTLNVYERVAGDFCYQAWLDFTASHQPILLITSVDSFKRLTTAVMAFDLHFTSINNQAWLFIEVTIVFSERIKIAMQKAGWQGQIMVVQAQSNQGICQSLKQWLAQ